MDEILLNTDKTTLHTIFFDLQESPNAIYTMAYYIGKLYGEREKNIILNYYLEFKEYRQPNEYNEINLDFIKDKCNIIGQCLQKIEKNSN